MADPDKNVRNFGGPLWYVAAPHGDGAYYDRMRGLGGTWDGSRRMWVFPNEMTARAAATG